MWRYMGNAYRHLPMYWMSFGFSCLIIVIVRVIGSGDNESPGAIDVLFSYTLREKCKAEVHTKRFTVFYSFISKYEKKDKRLNKASSKNI